MSTVCFSGSCKHISYILVQDGDRFKAEIDTKTEKITTQMFDDSDDAKCWIKKIINEQCSESNEIGRYN